VPVNPSDQGLFPEPNAFETVRQSEPPHFVAGQNQQRMQLEVEGYEPVRMLGKGGEGEVWEAIRIATGQSVALKVFNRSDYQNASTEFNKQWALSDHLSNHMRAEGSPFVTITGTGATRDGRHYLAMNLVDSDRAWRSTIETIFERKDAPLDAPPKLQVSLEQYISIFEETVRSSWFFAGVLHKVHRMGLVHRDIKPDNMAFGRVMTRISYPADPSMDFDSRPFEAGASMDDDFEGETLDAADFRESVLLDTGVMARWTELSTMKSEPRHDQEVEQPLRLSKDFKKFHATIPQASDTVSGTLRYMPPESFKGETGPWSDQYAFGLAVFEMLTGWNPRAKEPNNASMEIPSLWDSLPKEFLEKMKDPNFTVLGLPATSVVYILSEAVAQATNTEYSKRHRNMGQLANILSDCLEQDRVVRQAIPQSMRSELFRNERMAGQVAA
jgi:serine/threonine protein kinase